MTEKYIQLRDTVENRKKEIEDIKKSMEAKIDAGTVDGLKELFDAYNKSINGLEDLYYNNRYEIFEHLSNSLFIIAKNVNRLEDRSKTADDIRWDAKFLLRGEKEIFSIEDWRFAYTCAINDALKAGVVDTECASAIEDIYDYIDGSLDDFDPKLFPLLSNDGKANYLNSYLKAYCSANMGFDFTKENFSQKNLFVERILGLVSENPSLDYLNKDNIKNLDMIKDTLSRINDMKDFDILDESIEQSNAEAIKNVLSRIVSIAEPIERETDISHDDMTVL